ncbi:MAG: ATP-binding protein [Scytonema sp. PMC 1069.18]|nr:ATP-binding protein [Scytonema sp. PMC 1069.18]MEC4885143.1 ATP-binding protein [Scytonema sp. PMC 1070.18]
MTRNPFVVAQRVPPERFVGRKSEIDAAFDQIHNRSHLAIWGGPGMGKSSFLDKIASRQVWKEHEQDPSEAVIVLFSCLDINPFTASGFWKEVLRNMRDILENDKNPELQTEIEKLLGTEPITKDSLRQILRLLGKREKYLVLLLDNYDAALRENPHYTQADMLTFLGECRNLAYHAKERKYLSMIVTSLKRLSELGPPLNQFSSPWYNHYLFQSLKPFTLLEFQQLIGIIPQQAPQALQDVIREISGGHPALLQYAGFLLYRELEDAKEGQVFDAKAFAKNFESDTKQIFENIWARCSEEEQTLLMLIALFGLKGRLHQQKYDLSGIELIFSQKERDLTSLEEQGVLIRTELPKDKDVKDISEKGVIIRTEQGEKKILAFTSTIMERWVIQELGNTNQELMEKRRKVFLNLMSKEQVEKVTQAIQWVWSQKEEINSALEWFGKVSAALPKGAIQGLFNWV